MRIAWYTAGTFTHNYLRPYRTATKKDEWNGSTFVINPEGGEYDALLVTQSNRPLSREIRIICPPTRTLLVILEPPDILTLPDAYTSQFEAVICQDPRVKCSKLILGQSGHGWFVEVPITEALPAPNFEKKKLISAVVSSKQDTIGHRKRFAFMRALKEHFGDRLNWYGRGVNDIGERKIEALRDYKYHIVLENGAWPHYWTEKLADAYVANCFPFYWGAPNITDYFPSDSLIMLDLDNYRESIMKIESAISYNIAEKSQLQLREARRRVIMDYHPYQTVIDALNSLSNSDPDEIVVYPHTEFDFSLLQKIQFRINKIKNIQIKINN